MTNAGVNGWPSSDASAAVARLALLALGGRLASGRYYFPASPGSTSLSTTITNNSLRLVPWLVPNACTLSRIGAEVVTAGESNSKFRLGIYADDGTGLPGQLVLDAGQIAGDSNTVQELTISLSLTPGLYWIGGATQAAATTVPIMRALITSAASASSAMWNVPYATSIPGTNGQSVGVASSATVSGGLPSPFVWSGGAATQVARTFVKVA